jgi:hypothetical protein
MFANGLFIHGGRIPSERTAGVPVGWSAAGYAAWMGDEPYASRGLAASQLKTLLTGQADALTGSVVAVAFPGRGGVLWQPGSTRLVGPVAAEFERAIDALLDGIDLRSGIQVRDALLTMAGARLVVDRTGPVQ